MLKAATSQCARNTHPFVLQERTGTNHYSPPAEKFSCGILKNFDECMRMDGGVNDPVANLSAVRKFIEIFKTEATGLRVK